MERKLDLYAYRARFRPALLMCLAPVLGLIAWFPERFAGWTALCGVLTTFGLAALLTEFGRDLGKRKEPGLFRLWGGPPTTRFLRHRDSTLNQQTKRRYHEILGRLMPSVSMPTPAREEADPAPADEVYEACVDYLREATRDRKKFPLVFAELASYGFRRNLWGMKRAGLFLCGSGLLMSAGALLYGWLSSWSALPVAGVTLAINAALLVWWLLRVTPDSVRMVADEYARRLLGACELLDSQRRYDAQHPVLPPPTRSARRRAWSRQRWE